MTVFVSPINDLIQHDTDDTDGTKCVCGPAVEPVKRHDGSMGWMIIHHSLDGREKKRKVS